MNVEGVSVHHQVDLDEAREYSERAGVHHWPVHGVVAITIAGALVWVVVLYLLTLILDLFL